MPTLEVEAKKNNNMDKNNFIFVITGLYVAFFFFVRFFLNRIPNKKKKHSKKTKFGHGKN